jgi:hypothetical protein
MTTTATVGHHTRPAASERLPRREARSRAASWRLGLGQRLALPPHAAALTDHAAQHVVRHLDAAQVEAVLNAQQAAVDQHGERPSALAPAAAKPLLHPFLGDALAVSRNRSGARLQ